MEKGWYNDPQGRYLRRYFDGNDWTNQVQSSAGEVLTETAPGVAQPPQSGTPVLPPPQGAPAGGGTSTTPVKKSRKKLWIGVGVGVLIIAGIVGAANESSSNTNESSTEDTKTDEAPASSSDSSTANESPSGSGQSNSSGASDTSTAGNSNVQLALEYIDDVVQINNDGVEYMDQFSTLMFRSDAFSEEWQLDVAIVLVLLSGQYERALELNPPACFEEVHSHMLEANRLLVVMSQVFAEGVDTFDPSKIEQATEILYQSTDETVTATNLLNNLDPTECA